MLNPGAGALDQAGRGFQYGGQQANAGFPIGNLAGALQGNMQAGLQRQGLGGLQANAQQQAAQGRFTAQQQQQLAQLQLNQQYQQQRQGGVANAGLPNGVLNANAAASLAGVRQGLGGLPLNNNAQLNAAIRPNDRNNIPGLGGIGTAAAGQQNIGLPGYGAQGINQLQNFNQLNQRIANATQLQRDLNQLRGMQGMGGGMGAVNVMQQGNTAGRDLLGLFGQKGLQANQGVGGLAGQANADQTAIYANLIKQQQQQQLPQQQAAQQARAAGDYSIANPEDFPALGNAVQQRAGEDAQRGYPNLQGRGAFMLPEQFGVGTPGVADNARNHIQQGGVDYEAQIRFLQQKQQQAGGQRLPMHAGQAGMVGNQGQGGLLGAGGLADMAAAKAAAAGPPPDRWGLLAIMPLLKMTDQDATTLELGINLTTLGLDLTTTNSIHKLLQTPLNNQATRAEPDFELPACYRHCPQRLQPGSLSRFKEETLFYIFYSMPMDDAQMLAADELSVRGWLFHKKLRMWMAAAPNLPLQKKVHGERGTFMVFNPMIWEVETKPDLELAYEDLERPPNLPRPNRAANGQNPGHAPPGMQQNLGGQTNAPAAGANPVAAPQRA